MILNIGKTREPAGFSFATAFQLYGSLLAPAETLLRGKTHLMIVPTGPLTALPFQVLATSSVTGSDAGRLPWLIRRHALSTLPSVASLVALRKHKPNNSAPRDFIAFADPVFRPVQSASRTENPTRSGPRGIRGFASYFRAGAVDPRALQNLPRLADTADEVRIISQLFKGPTRVHLRGEANEGFLKREALNLYRIIHFATHGLIAGEIDNLTEPALALSTPASPSDVDDGLLTASEIAQLRLNADWVILSACNTAAGERPGAEALGGLARAFFYAGGKTLLVSHWPVVSSAAVKLTTGTLSQFERSGAIGRAEALQRAMLLLADSADKMERSPSYWAPFVLVGEGAR